MVDFKELQKMVLEPYKRLGFFDQWNMTDFKRAVEYLNNDNAFSSTFISQLVVLKDTINKLETLNQIAEVGLFGEEQGELLDAIRKNMPTSLPFKKKGETSVGEECADLFIRLSCYCERVGIDLENEIIKKHDYNSKRTYLHGKKA